MSRKSLRTDVGRPDRPPAGPYGAYRGETFVAVGLGDALTVKRIDVGGVDELARRWSGNGALNELRLRLMTASGSAPGTP